MKWSALHVSTQQKKYYRNHKHCRDIHRFGYCIMRDVMLYNAYKKLIEEGTEGFIQQQFPSMVKFFMKKSTPIVAPKITTTPPVHTPVVGDNRVTTVWMPGLLRQLNEPKQINIHCKEADLCDDSFTDEDEECEDFASDGNDNDVYEAAAVVLLL
jgi:hypothetical protein